METTQRTTKYPIWFCFVLFCFFQLLSRVRLFATPWTASLSFTLSRCLLKLMSIKSVMPSKISSSVTLFSCPQSFPASGSFLMSQPLVSGGQSMGASASPSVLPMNRFPLALTDLILQSKGLSRVFALWTTCHMLINQY